VSVLSTIVEFQLEARRVLFAEGSTLEQFEQDWVWLTERERVEYLETHNAPFGTRAADAQRASILLAFVMLAERRYLRPLLVRERALQDEYDDLEEKVSALLKRRDALRLAMNHVLNQVEEGIR
jgi:hypothetical protein